MSTEIPLLPCADHDPQPALWLNADGDLLAANARFRHWLGDRPLAQGRHLLPLNHLQLVRACLSQQRAIEDVETWVEGRGVLWSFIPDHRHLRVLVRGRDATRSMRQEQEAVRAWRLYRLIIENTTDLISRHAPDGRFLDASPASWRLLGYWPEQLVGQHWQELLHPADQQGMAEAWLGSLEQAGYHTVTCRVRHQDGHYLWLETASRAIRETYTGAVVEVVSVSRDISGRVQAEAQQRQLEDELAHAVRLVTLGELASGIAHEINQPLAAIMNYASAGQRYLQQPDDPQARARLAAGLDRISEHAARASEVIRRMRTFLRKGQRRVQPLAVTELVAETLTLCAWEAQRRQVDIRVRVPPAVPPLMADRVLLEQVLVNLLRNAMEANAEVHAGPSVVWLDARHDEPGVVWLEVRDQGPGLTADQCQGIFTPFYTSKQEGLGLGLAMSRTIVEGFGGDLDAVPGPEGGLVLRCRLPVKPTTVNSP